MNDNRSYAVLPSAIADEMHPRTDLTVSEWADKFRVVPPGTSPEPGPWRTERVPYLREILDAFSDPTVERIYIQAASQVGKSEILLCVLGYFADQEPAPILLVQSTEIAMRGFSKERVAPMFDASPALRGKLSEGARDPSNTIMLRQFPGGLLACAWAGSAASLASRPIRVVLGDELDRWPDTTGRDGDPWAQAVQRTSNFHNRKIGAVSTPTVEDFSSIARLYEDSDQRRYHVPCPHCGTMQVLEWSGIVYKRDGEIDLDDVHYRCAHCAERIEERHRPAMLAEGTWKAEREHRNRGYQISALYSPWVRWRELAAEWIKANADRDKRGLQEFVNLRLGETWTETAERITVEALEKNREPYGDGIDLPDGVLLLSAGVDVQDNRLEAEIVGWGAGRESWGIRYEIIVGDTTLAEPWEQLDKFLLRTWEKADGRALSLWSACVDSGGHRTDEVYTFCRDRVTRNVFAIKGYAGAGKPIVDKPTLNKFRAPLFSVGADTGKDVLFARLALADKGPGYCHFPLERGRGYDDEYYKGLLSEKRVSKVRAGRRTTEWKQMRARNEPLDARVYATAAMEIAMPDFGALAAADERARRSAPGTRAPAQRRRLLSRGVE